MTNIFLDTDVILDLFIDREPHHTMALRFFSYLERNCDTIQAYTSPVVIANVAYLLGRAKSEKYAVGKIKHLRTLVQVLQKGEANVDDFPTQNVHVLTPEELLAMEASNKPT